MFLIKALISKTKNLYFVNFTEYIVDLKIKKNQKQTQYSIEYKVLVYNKSITVYFCRLKKYHHQTTILIGLLSSK